MTGSKIILVVNGPDAPSVVAQLMTRINVDKPDCTVTAVRQHADYEVDEVLNRLELADEEEP